MELDDVIESPTILAVVATAAVMSPRVRRVARRGAVYGLAGLLMAGDAVSSFAKGVGQGVRQAAANTAGGPGEGQAAQAGNGAEG